MEIVWLGCAEWEHADFPMLRANESMCLLCECKFIHEILLNVSVIE
jgi:hypothetical protein